MNFYLYLYITIYFTGLLELRYQFNSHLIKINLYLFLSHALPYFALAAEGILCCCHLTSIAVATKIDEYVPKKIPIIRVNTKCLIEVPPSTNNDINTIITVREVLIDLAKV